MERISGLGTDCHPLGYTLPPLASVPSDGEKPSPTAADLPGPDPCAAAVLGPAGLRAAAALRHGDGCGDVPHGHVPAGRRPGAVERRVRSALASPDRWALRREPVSRAAVLPVPGGDQAIATEFHRPLPGISRGGGYRHARSRRAPRRRQLGIADARCMGPWLGGVAERHGGHAVHVFPAGWRARLPASDG